MMRNVKYEEFLVEKLCAGKRYKEYRKATKEKNKQARAERKEELTQQKAKRDAGRLPEMRQEFDEELEMSVRVRVFLDGKGLFF